MMSPEYLEGGAIGSAFGTWMAAAINDALLSTHCKCCIMDLVSHSDEFNQKYRWGHVFRPRGAIACYLSNDGKRLYSKEKELATKNDGSGTFSMVWDVISKQAKSYWAKCSNFGY